MVTKVPTQRLDGDLASLWRKVGEHLVHNQSRMDVRFDRLDGDVAVLKTDVAVLKTDVAELKVDVAVLKTDVAELKVDVAELKTDVAVLKTDVAELKVDVVEIKGQLGRLERASERRANRVDAKLEQLISLVQRAETKRP